MAKQVVYQMGQRQYRLVEVDTEAQAKAIRDLNRDCDKMNKREMRDSIRCKSLEEMAEQGKELVSEELQPDEQLFRREERAALKQAIEKLAPKQKRILYLRFWKGMTLERIAALEMIHISTVAGSLSSSIDKLKKFLKNF